MWKSVLVLMLLLIILADSQIVHELPSWGTASFVKTGVVSSHYSLVSKNNSHISIQSTNTSLETCNLEFKESHIGAIQTSHMMTEDSGSIIVLLFKQSSTRFKVLWLNHHLCLYNPSAILTSYAQSSFGPQVLQFSNYYEVYLDGHDNCLPCIFYHNGSRIESKYQLRLGDSSLFKSYIIKDYYAKIEHTSKYAFVGNFANGTAVLKILGTDYATIKEKHFNQPIEALAAQWNELGDSYIGITYAGLGNPRERILAQYSGNLNLLFETRVRPYSYYYKLSDTLLSINSTGYSFFSHINFWPSANEQIFSYKIIDPHGYLEASDFYKYIWPKDRDLQVFLDDEHFRAAIHEYKRNISTMLII